MTSQNPVVLIVEDERGLADLYAEWLAAEYEVRTAYTGEQAIESVDGDLDVVLLDRNLPDSSGDELLAEIRARGLECQVAMVTAVEPSLDVIDMGFDSYLAKPIRKAELVEVTAQLLNRKQLSAKTQELYRLVTKRALLETELSTTELAQSRDVQQLGQRIESLRAELDGKLERVVTDEEDIEEFWQSYLRTPTP